MSEKIAESAERDYGGSAFPTEGGVDSGLYPDPGMSLRDWFAGQALVAIADDCGMSDEEIAARCYERADAMIAERRK